MSVAAESFAKQRSHAQRHLSTIGSLTTERAIDALHG